MRPRSRLDVRVRVGVGDGAVTQVRSMPCSAVVGLQQAELRMTQPMASLLANMRLARRLAPRNPRRCAASCVSARLRPQATPPLGGTTQWGGSKLPPHRGGRRPDAQKQVPGGGHRRGAWDGAPGGCRAKRPCRIKKVFLLAKAAGAAEEEDLKAGGRFSGHATPLQPRSRRSVGIILLREVELLLVQGNDTSSSGPSTG